MGGCQYRVFLKKWPGLQTDVHLREVSASGGSTVVINWHDWSGSLNRTHLTAPNEPLQSGQE